MPELLAKLGLAEHAKKTARCPFHKPDQHPSFSIFKGRDGFWHYKCFVCDSCGGDEIAFLVKHLNVSRREAIRHYLEMAGFPTHLPKSREYPELPKFPVSPVHPMSNGQEPEKDLLAEKDLKGLAAHNACTAHNTARKRRWQLVRDLKAIELRWGLLDPTELMLTFDEWYRLSQPFLDAQKKREDYLAAFLANLGKVRVPTGEGQTIKEALDSVSRLPLSRLPVIPNMPDVPESWRRIAALHRDLSRRSADGIYFVTCRDAAKAFPGLSHQTAYNINLALAQLGAIEIVDRGDARPTRGRASQFRYLVPSTENGAQRADEVEDVEI
jgi:CHC2 zinc finger